MDGVVELHLFYRSGYVLEKLAQFWRCSAASKKVASRIFQVPTLVPWYTANQRILRARHTNTYLRKRCQVICMEKR
jgi:hypothetical protein